MNIEWLTLKCLSKIITFHISSWLIDNSTDVSSFESISYIKYGTLICLFLLLLDFHPFLSSWFALVLSCSIVTSDSRGFNGGFIFTDCTCNLKKCSIHMTKVIVSSTSTSSASVECLVLIFCFADIDSILPYHKVRHDPVLYTV